MPLALRPSAQIATAARQGMVQQLHAWVRAGEWDAIATPVPGLMAPAPSSVALPLLHWAAATRHAPLLKALLSLGLEVNAPDPALGQPPLGWAVTPPDFGQDNDVVELLLAAGADPRGRVERDAWRIEAPLIAALAGNSQRGPHWVNTSQEATATAHRLLEACRVQGWSPFMAWQAWRAVLLYRNDAWCERLKAAGADPVPWDEQAARAPVDSMPWSLPVEIAAHLQGKRLAWAFDRLVEVGLTWWERGGAAPDPKFQADYERRARSALASKLGAVVAQGEGRRERF